MQNKYQFVSILYVKSHNLTGDTLMFFKKEKRCLHDLAVHLPHIHNTAQHDVNSQVLKFIVPKSTVS